MDANSIGLGGGCHWCTEGVFSSLRGVTRVQQGWISSTVPYQEYSEGILIEWDSSEISLKDIIEIHLLTHASTVQHSMRKKYRSAIYTLKDLQIKQVEKVLDVLRTSSQKPIVTKVLPFVHFKENEEQYLDYLYKNPKAPFCQTHISPKLQKLKERFSHSLDKEKIAKLDL